MSCRVEISEFCLEFIMYETTCMNTYVFDGRVLLETVFSCSTFILKSGYFCTIQVFGGAHFLLCVGAEKNATCLIVHVAIVVSIVSAISAIPISPPAVSRPLLVFN